MLLPFEPFKHACFYHLRQQKTPPVGILLRQALTKATGLVKDARSKVTNQENIQSACVTTSPILLC